VHSHLGKPQYDQAVEQQGHGGRSPDGGCGPALRLLHAQVRFTGAVCFLDRPALGIFSQDRFGGRWRVGRVEGLDGPASAKGLDRDDAQGTVWDRVPASHLSREPDVVMAAVDVEAGAMGALLQQLLRGRQRRTAATRPAGPAGLRRRRRIAQTRLQRESTGQAAIGRQVTKDTLASVGGIGEQVKSVLG
jgi:hypothetical protein